MLKPSTSLTSKLIQFLGIGIMIAALIYLLYNLDHADSIVKVWMVFMIAGILLVFLGTLINGGRRSGKDRKSRSFHHN